MGKHVLRKLHETLHVFQFVSIPEVIFSQPKRFSERKLKGVRTVPAICDEMIVRRCTEIFFFADSFL